MNDTLKDKMLAAYIDWVNNFLTLEKFAEHYGISEKLAFMIIDEMREYNEFLADIEKAKKLRENTKN